MLSITDGAEVLLKSGVYARVTSASDTWRGTRFTAIASSGGQDQPCEFGPDDVRAVLSAERSAPACGSGNDAGGGLLSGF